MKYSATMYLALCAILAGLVLSGCGASGEGASAAVEGYLQALAAKNETALIQHSCAAWEQNAMTDARAYDGVEVRLEGISCQVSGAEGDFTIVACEGAIIGTYFGEDRPFDLAARNYLALEEGGEWRMCGYR